MDYLGQNLRRLRQAMADQQAIVEQQAILVNRINGQIQLLRSKRSKSEQIVRVQIDAPKTANYEISISYLEGNAGWRPSYELSCTSLDQALHLVAKGKVQQQTGTDWKQVDLKLTTADPSRGNMPPEFEIFRLNFGRPHRPQPIGGPSLLPPDRPIKFRASYSTDKHWRPCPLPHSLPTMRVAAFRAVRSQPKMEALN